MKKKGIAIQIQTKIGKTVGIIFIVVAIVVGLVTTNSITDANNTELTLESESAAYQLSDFFNQYCTIAEQLTTNQDIQHYLETTLVYEDVVVNENFADVMKTLDTIQSLHPETIQGVFVGDADADGLIMSGDYVSEKGWDMKSRPWYAATELGHTMLTEPYVDVNTGGMVLTISTPVYNSAGNLLGVAGLDIALDDIVTTVSQYKIGESGFVALLSSDGMFIYHPKSESIGTYISAMDASKELIDAVLNKQHTFLKYNVNGDPKFGCVATVGDTGYVVISCIPVAPPGARSLSQLHAKCTACHLCVSKCPTHVLQPAIAEYGLQGVMQPVMRFDKGYCLYDCTLCGEVCPTGAIDLLDREVMRLMWTLVVQAAIRSSNSIRI